MIVLWALAAWFTVSLLIGFFILIRELLRERKSRPREEGVYTRLDEDLLSGRKSPEKCFRAIDRAEK